MDLLNAGGYKALLAVLGRTKVIFGKITCRQSYF
jgi:hypothetical protein